MPTQTCRWVIRNASSLESAEYCDVKTAYTMIDDGGEKGAQKRRKYKPFCAKHQALVDEEDEE